MKVCALKKIKGFKSKTNIIQIPFLKDQIGCYKVIGLEGSKNVNKKVKLQHQKFSQ